MNLVGGIQASITGNPNITNSTVSLVRTFYDVLNEVMLNCELTATNTTLTLGGKYLKLSFVFGFVCFCSKCNILFDYEKDIPTLPSPSLEAQQSSTRS